MPLTFNPHQLEKKNLLLRGHLPLEELDLETRDEMVRAASPLRYELELQRLERAVLAQGRLELMLDCQCVRCLKPFELPVRIGEWTRHIPLAGEEKALIVNDVVDLTPYVREDILLAFPQHPLCKTDCSGLAGIQKQTEAGGEAQGPDAGASPWAALDQLKLKR